MSSISLFEVIDTVVPDPTFFFFSWIPASDAAAYAVNANGIKTLLANILSTFSIFSNDPRGLPRAYPECTVLDKWIFDNFILAD